MSDDRVVTAVLPASLFKELDGVVARIDRTKSWVIREAIQNWLEDEERRQAFLAAEPLVDLKVGQRGR